MTKCFATLRRCNNCKAGLVPDLLGQVVGAGSPLSSTDTPGNCSFARGGQPIALPGLQNLVHMAMTVERMGTKSASNVLSKLQNPKKMFTSYFFLALLVISP